MPKGTKNKRDDLAACFKRERLRISRQWIQIMKLKCLSDTPGIDAIKTEHEKMLGICIKYLESDDLGEARAYCAAMAKKAVLSGMTSSEIMIGCHAMRDLLERVIFEDYGQNSRETLLEILDIYEPVVNNLLSAAYDAFIAEREKKINQEHEAHLESENLYHTLTESVADGIVLIEFGRLSFVNSAFVSMFGYSDQEDLLGKKLSALVDKEFLERFEKKHKELEAGLYKENRFRCKFLTREGYEFWAETHPIAIKWKGGIAILSTFSDVTDLTHMEMAKKRETDYLRRENIKLKSAIKARHKFGEIIGKSPAIQNVYELILKAGVTDANVIIYGESGTGKELAARAIHKISDRCDKAFVPVNAAAIPENLLESEFFGHKKGSFTGAGCDKCGYMDAANGGTLFLDEVGEISLNMQAKLLRAIDGNGYMPIGGRDIKNSDFRIIAATNKDLKDYVKSGLMREDFFFRLHIIPITLPPLRERKEDIALLVEHFFLLYNKDKRLKTIPGKIIEALYSYDWPGNVRELQNVLQRYLAIGNLGFLNHSIPQHDMPGDTSGKSSDHDTCRLKPALVRLEKSYIMSALDRNAWNRSSAAMELGISRKTLFRKLKEFGSS